MRPSPPPFLLRIVSGRKGGRGRELSLTLRDLRLSRSGGLPPGALSLGALSLGALLFGALLLGGCIDTALSLVVTLEDATIQADGEALSITADVNVRVGEYALAGDDFILPRAAVFADGEPQVQFALEPPMDFDGRLEPGEERTVRVTGRTMGSIAPLCAGSPDVEVTIQWQANQQADDPLDPPIMAIGTAAGSPRIVCP